MFQFYSVIHVAYYVICERNVHFVLTRKQINLRNAFKTRSKLPGSIENQIKNTRDKSGRIDFYTVLKL
jgi:hypothetical protein